MSRTGRLSTLILSVIIFACSSLTCCYAEGIDIQSMDTDALISLRNSINLELQVRPEASPFEVGIGTYVIGEDIAAGNYYIAAKGLSRYTAGINIYENSETYTSGETLDWFYLPVEDDAKRSILKEGYIIEVASAPLMFSLTEYEGGRYYTYTLPEGTYVPAGIYTVGIEIPAGTYQFFAATLDSRNVHLYQTSINDEECDIIRIDASDTEYETAILSDGNVLEVRTDIVMKKQPKLSFE